MTRFFCTYFDRNYLVKGLCLIDSLRRQTNGQLKIFVVCMDEITRLILEAMHIAEIQTIPMHEIEKGDHALLATRPTRSIVEYIWTTTPTIILRVLERHPEIDILTYVDSDLYFFSTPEPIYNELGSKSALIHEHRFSPRHAHLEKNGKFNVGLLCFKRDEAGFEILRWWRDRCIEWCYLESKDGKMGDQGYLSDWPTRFPAVCVSQNPGVGVAPWNHENYVFTKSHEGVPLVNGTPIMFYHFHSFSFINPEMIIPAEIGYAHSLVITQICALPYVQMQFRQIERCRRIIPDFLFGLRKEGYMLNGEQVFLATKRIAPELTKLGVPQQSTPVDDIWLWYHPPGLH